MSTLRLAAPDEPAHLQRGLDDDAIIVVDDIDRVIEWNGAATLMFGYEREEALGQDLGVLIIPESQRPAHRYKFASLFEEGSRLLVEPFEGVAMRSGGEQIAVRTRVVRTATRPPNFVVSIEDLSAGEPSGLDRRQLTTIVECSEDAMATLTTDGVVTSWNPAATELYGFTAEDAIGCRLASLIVPRELMHEPQQWLRHVLDGRIVTRETRRLRKDRSEVLVSVRLMPVRDRGNAIVGSVMIARDVTDRRLLAELERRDDEIELWESRIQTALQGGRFAFAAQPIVRLGDGEVDHHELLLRMRMKDRLATPREFIFHAERSGQILELDLWATRRGLELARYRPVAINLSVLSMGNDELLMEICRLLESTEVDPARITFEITETAAVEDLKNAVGFAQRLTAMGCRVALDDFGTGFGSFTYLNRLPVTELKIDREFVAQLRSSDAARRIVQTIVDIARNFGMRTVAEGVEDEASLQLLRELGVDLAQGYLIGMPLTVGPSWCS